MTDEHLNKFINESNRIEGVDFQQDGEFEMYRVLLEKPELERHDLQNFVKLVAGARLRDRFGLDVRVGGHVAPKGGIEVVGALAEILSYVNDMESKSDPYLIHIEYEILHPFTDGNGRSGRLLWAYMMDKEDRWWPEIGFLHSWYYQSLAHSQ